MKRLNHRFVTDLENKFEHCLCETFSAGVSAIEIGRLVGKLNVLSIYRCLQKNGLIGNTQRRSKWKAPALLERELKRAGISFTMWCNSWSIDPGTAESALLSAGNSSGAGAIRDEAARDFPKLFGKPGRGPSVAPTEWNFNDWEDEDFSYHLDWDSELGMHVGTIPGISSLKMSGGRPLELLTHMLRVAWLMRCIKKLGSANKYRTNKQF